MVTVLIILFYVTFINISTSNELITSITIVTFPTTMVETIALFGATGRTGIEFLKLALEEGYAVKALVRNPSKVTIQNERLALTQGDFENVAALEEVTDGATYVVCMAAAALVDGVYPKGFMLNFVKRLYPILQRSPAKVFLYQAGSMSADGNDFLHPIAWVMKQTLGRRLKIFDKIDDNDAAIHFIGENSSNFKFVVTRAGVLKKGPSEKKVGLSNWVSWNLYYCLGCYTLVTILTCHSCSCASVSPITLVLHHVC